MWKSEFWKRRHGLFGGLSRHAEQTDNTDSSDDYPKGTALVIEARGKAHVALLRWSFVVQTMSYINYELLI